jgi:glutaconate CoA-transferase subunit B
MTGETARARREAMLAAILRRLEGCATIAVGASSPLPGAAALLARARWGARVLILGSRRHNDFTDGGRELFDLAAQGRLDAFFLSGGQIDGRANINLLGIGAYPDGLTQRFPGSFGSAYLYFLVPRVILFREEHERRSLPDRVDVVSAPGLSPPGVYRPGGPVALVTGRCVFSFDRGRGRFALESVHAGEDVSSVRDATGFDYDAPAVPPPTAGLTDEDRELLRLRVADEIAETYPRFAAGLRAA